MSNKEANLIGPDDAPRSIYIVGNNVRANDVYYHGTVKKRIKKYAAGIYYDADLTAEQAKNLVALHINRILEHKFPGAVLVGGSSLNIGLYNNTISLHSEKRKAGLKIGDFDVTFYHNNSGLIPSNSVEYQDNLGKGRIRVSADEYTILMACRKIKNKNELITVDDFYFVLRRLMSNNTKERLQLIMKSCNDNYVQDDFALSRALKIIDQEYGKTPHDSEVNKDTYNVFLVGKKIAEFAYDGISWIYRQKHGIADLSLSRNKMYGTVPFFMESIITETWIQKEKSHTAGGFHEIENADRYISNIVIRRDDESRNIIIDSLEGRLSDLTNPDGTFAGDASCILPHDSRNMYRDIYNICSDSDAPRMSGAQVKMPVNIDRHGMITPAINKKFTHIIKMPAAGVYSTMGAIEWYSMRLAKQVGIKTEDFAVCNIENVGITFVAERFDIRSNADADDIFITEDFCSVMGMENKDKYKGDMMDVAKKLLEFTTDRDEDAVQLFRSVVFSWLIGNYDMHLKNMMFLKSMSSGMTGFKRIELSPAYDIMCTNIYPAGASGSAAIGIDGEKIYSAQEFMKLARALNMTQSHAKKVIKAMIVDIRDHLKNPEFDIPQIILDDEAAITHVYLVNELLEHSCNDLEMDLENVKEPTKIRMRR